jgi:secondary thiamine-phosphate synthase enzyme
LVTLISNHTTAYVTLNESESNLQRDMTDLLAKVAPPNAGYGHDLDPVDGRANAHAHLVGLFMNASETIPLIDGRLLLGTWQSILFVELDGPREERSVHVHVLGEDRA